LEWLYIQFFLNLILHWLNDLNYKLDRIFSFIFGARWLYETASQQDFGYLSNLVKLRVNYDWSNSQD